MKYILLLIALIASSVSQAEEVEISIPDQGWKIKYDAPIVKSYRGRTSKGDFIYESASRNGFYISIFVETPSGKKGHKNCADYYWSMAKKNPKIDKSTIKISEKEKWVVVSYIIKDLYKEEVVVMQNYNFFFEYKGKWVDIHISKND